MASFELFPVPEVTAVEAGFFLLNMVIIKKLILNPYMKLKDKRELATVGSQDEAKKIIQQCESLSESITKQLGVAAQEARESRESIRTEAVKKRESILAAAEKDARKVISDVQTEVESKLQAERARVPEIVNSLTQEVYAAALN
jgi:F0F1-type ATP synthase membrane subunit b/b'